MTCSAVCFTSTDELHERICAPYGVAGKLNAARDYLTVAPRVVGTVRTLPLPTVDTALPSRPPDAERLLELAERWGIDNVLGRSVKALGSPP